MSQNCNPARAAARPAPLNRPRARRRRSTTAPRKPLTSARQWRGSKGAYNRPSYPRHYCTYRGGLLRQGAVDKAKADDQHHAGERQHHHLQVRKAVGGKQRKIVHDTAEGDARLACLWRAEKKRAAGVVWVRRLVLALA